MQSTTVAPCGDYTRTYFLSWYNRRLGDATTVSPACPWWSPGILPCFRHQITLPLQVSNQHLSIGDVGLHNSIKNQCDNLRRQRRLLVPYSSCRYTIPPPPFVTSRLSCQMHRQSSTHLSRFLPKNAGSPNYSNWNMPCVKLRLRNGWPSSKAHATQG